MMTIREMKQLYNQGVPVSLIMARAGIEDGDEGQIRRVLSATGTKARRTTIRRNSKRTNYASQVLARGAATLELVSRVNASSPAPAIAEIPFDGMCDDSPEEITGRDWYGL